jgi:steroid delta-isomerase
MGNALTITGKHSHAGEGGGHAHDGHADHDEHAPPSEPSLPAKVSSRAKSVVTARAQASADAAAAAQAAQPGSPQAAGPDITAEAVARVVKLYNHLKPADLAKLNTFYASRAWFKDPFNEVVGVRSITRIFEHMFRTVVEPRFEVLETVTQPQQSFLTWNFHFRLKNYSPHWICVRGSTHLKFDESGLIIYHRDYWDTGEEFFAKMPMVGWLMRWLQVQGRAR